jgi:REP element-mobilizing transposase RayT
MPDISPIYTLQNCSFSCPLEWGVSVFWRAAERDDVWYAALAAALEGDGIRLLGHRFCEPRTSQFAVSTLPHVAPVTIVQRIKGRLQHLVRERLPKPLQRNYAIRTFGRVTRQKIEAYVASQLEHHEMADPRVQQRLRQYQIEHRDVDLSQPRQTSHGLYWYNLHVVLVHRERWPEIREDVLSRVHHMITNACTAKGWLLSRAGILADHVHLVVGCSIDVSPLDVALSFLNNLSYAHGMRPVYQFGGFIGTFGEYDQRAVHSETPLYPGQGGDE